MKNIPTHIAMIMDGNGRWAKAQGLPRIEGHKAGLATAERIIDFSIQKGIKFVSLFVFSTENWKRPKVEVATLFSLAESYIKKFEYFCTNRVRVVFSGEKMGLPQNLVRKMEQIQRDTESFDAICVNLCINYGGRTDIVEAVKQVVQKGLELNEQNILQNLYNPFIPEPDIVIRTGGQMRLSNFLMFQSAYSELFFTDTLWPDFGNDEYNSIIQRYATRTRNFGGLTSD